MTRATVILLAWQDEIASLRDRHDRNKYQDARLAALYRAVGAVEIEVERLTAEIGLHLEADFPSVSLENPVAYYERPPCGQDSKQNSFFRRIR